jgi:hypothetical protein
MLFESLKVLRIANSPVPAAKMPMTTPTLSIKISSKPAFVVKASATVNFSVGPGLGDELPFELGKGQQHVQDRRPIEVALLNCCVMDTKETWYFSKIWAL